MHEETSRRTLRHYETHAREFRDGTLDHDVSQNVNALLAAIEGPGKHRILDFGPGRDLVTFRKLGHHPVGLDGCERFVEMARANAGVQVWHQDFLSLSLPSETFDGVFANASLFHIPSVVEFSLEFAYVPAFRGARREAGVLRYAGDRVRG